MSYANANQLIQAFVTDYGNLGRTYKVIEAVMDISSRNTAISMLDNSGFLFNGTGGKLRQVRMNYFPVLCDVEGSCNTNLCDTGIKIEPKQELFTITECTASKIWSLSKNDIRLIDNNSWDFNDVARQMIGSTMPAMRRVHAIKMLTKLYALAGTHPDGNPEKRVTVTNPTNGVVNPMGMFEIDRENLDAGFETPYILGGAEVYNWQKMVGIGGLNASGQYINDIDTSRSYYDDGLSDLILNDLANGGHILSIAPHAIKYVWYLENAGIFSTDLNGLEDLDRLYASGSNGFIEGTLIDPVTGLPWDLYINYDKCTSQWTIQIKHRWDIFVMPYISCSISNGLMKWRTCPLVIANCPTGTTPSPAVTPTTYSWTPNMTLLPNVSNSVIAGFANQLNQPQLTANVAALVAYMNANSQGITFTQVGNDIRYTGVSAITASFNNGSVTATFA